jgi:hypothetical protein
MQWPVLGENIWCPLLTTDLTRLLSQNHCHKNRPWFFQDNQCYVPVIAYLPQIPPGIYRRIRDKLNGRFLTLNVVEVTELDLSPVLELRWPEYLSYVTAKVNHA